MSENDGHGHEGMHGTGPADMRKHGAGHGAAAMHGIKIAVIDNNVLAAMGLQRILADIIPVADVQVFISFDELLKADEGDFVHYFVSSRVFFEYASFFRSNGRRPIVLVGGDMQVAGVPTINVCQPERGLVKSILAIHGAAHGSGAGRGHMALGAMAARPAAETDAALSPREVEVVSLLAKGCINKEVADKLGIGVTTVITHRRNIMEKLHARSLADVIIYAVMNGIIEVGEL